METLSVKETISSILTEVCEAVESVRKSKSYVAPQVMSSAGNPAGATNVEFDLAISVTKGSSTEDSKNAGLSIGVLSVKVGAEATKDNLSQSSVSTVSRIKFSVPVYFQHKA